MYRAMSENKVSGVGWWWSTYYYTIWDGSKWLPLRKLTSSAAMEWYLDQKEKHWNNNTYLYKYDGSWQRAA